MTKIKSMKQSQLINELIKTSKQLNIRASEISQLPLNDLNKRPNEKAWNTLECFKHLNLYIDIYNDFFEESLQKASRVKKDKEIKAGLFGAKFISLMEPKEDGIKKMSTFRSKDPIHCAIPKTEIDHFIASNSKTIQFLEESKKKDIQSVKCKLAIPLLKIKLSDSFQFLVAHNKRHFIQIKNAIN